MRGILRVQTSAPRTWVVLLVVSLGATAAGVSAGQAAAKDPSLGEDKARGSTNKSGCDRSLKLDPEQFPATPDVDNQFLPLTPGTRLVLRGTSNVTGETAEHLVTFIVTDLAKDIAGVSSLVVYDVDSSDGVVTEAELAFFAQDDEGNVWSLGEYPEEYENGEFTGAPSTWIAGSGNAQAGIHMMAEPVIDGQYYMQGWAPKVHFLDCATVIETGATTMTLSGEFDGVLVTDEVNPYEPQAGSQLKYHAPDVGIVRVGFVDDPQGEVLELDSLTQLSKREMDAARAAALALDARGYENAEVYQDTGPATQFQP